MKLKKLSVAILSLTLLASNFSVTFAVENPQNISLERNNLPENNIEKNFVQETKDVSTVQELKQELEAGHNVNLLNDINIDEKLNIDFDQIYLLSEKMSAEEYEKLNLSITINGNGHTIKGYDSNFGEDEDFEFIRFDSDNKKIREINFTNINIESNNYSINLSTDFNRREKEFYRFNENVIIKNTKIIGENISINGAVFDNSPIITSILTLNSGEIKNVKHKKLSCDTYKNISAINIFNGFLTLNGGSIYNNDTAVSFESYVSLSISNVNFYDNKEDFDIKLENTKLDMEIGNDNFSSLTKLPTLKVNLIVKDKVGNIVEKPKNYDKDDLYYKIFQSYIGANAIIRNNELVSSIQISTTVSKKDEADSNIQNTYAYAKVNYAKLNSENIVYTYKFNESYDYDFGGVIENIKEDKDYVLEVEIQELDKPLLLETKNINSCEKLDENIKDKEASDIVDSGSLGENASSSSGIDSIGRESISSSGGDSIRRGTSSSGGGGSIGRGTSSSGGTSLSKATGGKSLLFNKGIVANKVIITNKEVATKGIWIKVNNNWKLRLNEKEFANKQWANLDNKWYIFDENGNMLTGINKINNVNYLFNTSGEMLSLWIKYNNYWYYANPNGDLVTGWILSNNKWYFLESNGIMASNKWVQEKDGKWYYLKVDGAMAVNEITPDGYKVDVNGVWIK